MHKAFCQSVVGLKKSFDAEIGDTVAQVKATVRFKCPVTEAGIYHEKDVVMMTPEEYEALTSGRNFLIPESFIQGLDTLRTIIQDLVDEARKGQKEE